MHVAYKGVVLDVVLAWKVWPGFARSYAVAGFDLVLRPIGAATAQASGVRSSPRGLSQVLGCERSSGVTLEVVLEISGLFDGSKRNRRLDSPGTELRGVRDLSGIV